MRTVRDVSSGGVITQVDGNGLQVVLVGRARPERWSIPKGTPIPGETLEETAVREVREETGLRVDRATSLLWVVESPAKLGRGLTFVFRVSCDDTSECAAADPDEIVKEAVWVPKAEAIERLAALPFRRMAEPAAKVLRGDVAEGSLWIYAVDDEGVDQLSALIAPNPTTP